MTEKRKTCGIIMPIGDIGDYTATHWKNVFNIFSEASIEAGFEPNMVSNAQETTIIHGTIVKNVYQSDIILCDVSAKNANVMLELGMRLAFDRPSVVVKDDITSYSFDTSPIQHLEYPYSLHYQRIVTFKSELPAKIKATAEANSTGSYNSFLQGIGDIKVQSIKETEVGSDELILDRLKSLEIMIARQSAQSPNRVFAGGPSSSKRRLVVTMGDVGQDAASYSRTLSQNIVGDLSSVTLMQSPNNYALNFTTPLPASIARRLKSELDAYANVIDVPEFAFQTYTGSPGAEGFKSQFSPDDS